MKNSNHKTETEKMLFEIFRICDETVWLKDWNGFQKSFGKIIKKYGYDLRKIYFEKK